MPLAGASALLWGEFCGRKGRDLRLPRPNGAGKTTTIRLLMQLLRPDRGHAALFDVPLDVPKAALRERIGYLPGEFNPLSRRDIPG